MMKTTRHGGSNLGARTKESTHLRRRRAGRRIPLLQQGFSLASYASPGDADERTEREQAGTHQHPLDGVLFDLSEDAQASCRRDKVHIKILSNSDRILVCGARAVFVLGTERSVGAHFPAIDSTLLIIGHFRHESQLHAFSGVVGNVIECRAIVGSSRSTWPSSSELHHEREIQTRETGAAENPRSGDRTFLDRFAVSAEHASNADLGIRDFVLLVDCDCLCSTRPVDRFAT